MVLFGLGLGGVLLEEGVYIYRRAQLYMTGAPVTEKGRIVYAHRDYAGGPMGSALHCDAAYPLLQGQERMHRAVTAFREKGEGHTVLQDMVNLGQGVPVAGDFPYPVPQTYHRNYLEPVQDAGGGGAAEDIGPGAEGYAAMTERQHHQGVHQGIGMVGGKDYGAVGGKLSLNLETPVTQAGT